MLCFPLLHLQPPLTLQLPKLQSKTHFPSLHFSERKISHQLLSRNPSGYRSICSCSSSPRFALPEDDFNEELDRLLLLLPDEMQRRIREHPEHLQLIEVVMDLGRKPLARFPSGDFVLSDCQITADDLNHATSQVGHFAVDNRAGISRTLHRISAVRNRKGVIIGLTCRVGRAISGTANLLRDLIQDGGSLLLIGPPGVGKTTIIREIARMLSTEYNKRVMIVDTSNEIGGDGDIPHSGIGKARRMQVPNSDMQHKVLIEAVENHMPQVIVIDEIGTKLEAMAASTIAQRGIQLVATAHGVTIENLIMNPSLEMLVGGIQCVTLGDEEASRRGVQKTVLERKGPTTFSCGVEIISKTELRVYCSLEATVDAILCGRHPYVEVRKITSSEKKETASSEPFISAPSLKKKEIFIEDASEMGEERTRQSPYEFPSEVLQNIGEDSWTESRRLLRLFVYGILEATVIQAIKQLKMDVNVIQFTDNISEADAILALHSKIKKNSRIQAAAKSHDLPIYVTKTSSLVQVTKVLWALINDHEDSDIEESGPADKIKSSEEIDALEETRMAIEHIVILKGEAVDLLPRSSQILSLQMDLIQKYQLESEIIGKDMDARLRILPFHNTGTDEEKKSSSREVDDDDDDDDYGDGDYAESGSANGSTNGSLYRVDRLPLLPDH